MIRRGSFTGGVAQLRKAILEYIEEHNRDPRLFQWNATPDQIFKKIEKFCSKLA